VALDESRNEDLQVRFRYTLLGLGDTVGNPFGSTRWLRTAN
jgi:hypothetical protein